MQDNVVDLGKFRKGPAEPKGNQYIVQDRTGMVHQITAEKMGTSPTALCFFAHDGNMIFALPLELLYLGTIADPEIVRSFNPQTAVLPVVEQVTDEEPEATPAA